MEENNIQKKVIQATKWSTITEVAAKLVAPITNMVLARVLTPEAFGVVATITMVISFAEMFADSGFQKYLVQREFKNEKEKFENANVAFWTNLSISIILWLIIFIFREDIATLVGNPGLGMVLAIASLELPMTSFSSIQMALYRRDFDFKTLFIVRIFSIIIPFIVTIPLALLGLNYWALIIGNLCKQLSNAIILTLKSKWKPQLYYSVEKLKEMFSFSAWSLIEAISIWLTSWVGTFIIGTILNQYYLGIYKTSVSLVNALMGLVTSALVPVLFSSLSRLQNDNRKFSSFYFQFQRAVSILIFPLGVGVFLYSDLATKIMLGDQWAEASSVIGHWALTSSIMIVIGNFSTEVYRAKGRPKLSFLAQMLHLIVLVPTIYYSAKHSFGTLIIARSWIRMQFVLVHLIILKFAIGLSIRKILNNVLPTFIVSIVMGIFGYFLKQLYSGIIWDIISIFLCVIFYFAILLAVPTLRNEIKFLFMKFAPEKLLNKVASK